MLPSWAWEMKCITVMDEDGVFQGKGIEVECFAGNMVKEVECLNGRVTQVESCRVW